MQYPKLETRSADDVAAEVIQNLPPELDRSPDGYWPRFIHWSIKPFYAAMIFILNDVPRKLHLWLLNRMGFEPLAATPALVTVEFTAATLAGATVPAGTVVKNSTGLDAHKFKTNRALTPSDFSGKTATVQALAITPGSAPNRLAAHTLTMLETPIPGIDSVTNHAPPTGGEDIEPWKTFLKRVPVEMRATRDASGELMAITREDFELITLRTRLVARAKALRTTFYNHSNPDMAPGPNDQLGAVAMILVDANLNAAPDPATAQAIIDELTRRTVPGVTVTAHFPTIRRVYVSKVEAVLHDWATIDVVQDDMISKLEHNISTTDIVSEDKKSIDFSGWPWGKSLHYNDLVALLTSTDGVERIGRIWAQVSDNDGATWSAPTVLSEIKAGADTNDNGDYGLLHWQPNPSQPFELSEI